MMAIGQGTVLFFASYLCVGSHCELAFGLRFLYYLLLGTNCRNSRRSKVGREKTGLKGERPGRTGQDSGDGVEGEGRVLAFAGEAMLRTKEERMNDLPLGRADSSSECVEREGKAIRMGQMGRFKKKRSKQRESSEGRERRRRGTGLKGERVERPG